ncbi:SUMF1/EgtB/PvdO family nonheme iron enzyme [bacterium]|nr:SUMF1/EgtB/PvdO family nonheme iron enzyme [candidate division CSSED10-310 bacterium]
MNEELNKGTIGNLPTDGEHLILSGRYLIVRKLGEGGMGAVYLAEDTRLDNHPVAVKSLPLILAGNPRALKQLKQEAKMAIRLSHSHIATLRSFEESLQGPFLVMDYIPGKTLEDVLNEKGTLTVDEVRKLFRPIADALDYAHSKGVIHRDIKPSNILIHDNGEPFISDFGIAREMKESMTRMTGKDTSGTLPYMSPEQVNGELPKREQDIYSLAATMYECLTGEPPFCRGDIYHQILSKPADISRVPEDFREALMKGLSKDPADRLKTCISLFDIEKQYKQMEMRKIPNDHSRSKSQNKKHHFLNGTLDETIKRSPGDVWTEKYSGIELIWVPSGMFKMGSGGRGAYKFEKPVHEVKISEGFWIGKYPITQEQYEKIMGENPSLDKGLNNPVEGLEWNNAIEFCELLTKKTGMHFSLPTEAQWEFAARGGPLTKGFRFPGSDNIDEVGWYIENSGSSQPVGMKKPNELGIHDMAGNVYEYCQDWWDPDFYNKSPILDPKGPDSGTKHVFRGGCFNSISKLCRPTYRSCFDDEGLIGFRIVLNELSGREPNRKLSSDIANTIKHESQESNQLASNIYTTKRSLGDIVNSIIAAIGCMMIILMIIAGIIEFIDKIF